MRTRPLAMAVVMIIVTTSAVYGQERGTTPTAMGRTAAEDESVAAYFLAGMLGGTGVGITATHYLRAGDSEAPYRPVIAGVAILLGTGVAIELTAPTPRDPHLGPAGTIEYQHAFRERVRDRRRNALAFGTIAGFAAGAAIHVWLTNLGR